MQVCFENSSKVFARHGPVLTQHLRQRHIKCDEERPACNRCIQAGLACPGYNHTTPRPKRGSFKRCDIPEGNHNIVLAPAIKKDDIVPRSPPLKEEAAIDFFITNTLRLLAKYVPDTQLWTATAFQSLLLDAKIRNVVIAIGLAHQDMRNNLARGCGPYTSAVRAERLGTASPSAAMDADRYYNASLAFMRTDISTVREGATGERTDVAVACLLLVIYLSLHNRMEEAAVHMSCGLEVVCEGGPVFIIESKVNQEIYLLFLHFSTSSWPAHPSAPLYDIMQTTVELSIYLTGLDSLTALRTDMDLCAQRVYTFAHRITRGTFPDAKYMTDARDALTEEFDLMSRRIVAYASPGQKITSDAEEMEKSFIDAMRARLILFRLFTNSVATRYQTTYDRHTQRFDEIVELIWSAIRRGPDLIGTDWLLISIHFNVIGTLRQLNLHCRHPTIRRRSLALLKHVPQREGIIEAGEGHQLGNMILDFEEADLNLDLSVKFPTHIPEENRLHFVESIRRAQLQGVELADDEIMVRLMYRPDGESAYVERRVRKKKSYLDLSDQDRSDIKLNGYR